MLNGAWWLRCTVELLPGNSICLDRFTIAPANNSSYVDTYSLPIPGYDFLSYQNETADYPLRALSAASATSPNMKLEVCVKS